MDDNNIIIFIIIIIKIDYQPQFIFPRTILAQQNSKNKLIIWKYNSIMYLYRVRVSSGSA